MNLEKLSTAELEAKLGEAERLADQLRTSLKARRETLRGPAGAATLRDSRYGPQLLSAAAGRLDPEAAAALVLTDC